MWPRLDSLFASWDHVHHLLWGAFWPPLWVYLGLGYGQHLLIVTEVACFSSPPSEAFPSSVLLDWFERVWLPPAVCGSSWGLHSPLVRLPQPLPSPESGSCLLVPLRASSSLLFLRWWCALHLHPAPCRLLWVSHLKGALPCGVAWVSSASPSVLLWWWGAGILFPSSSPYGSHLGFPYSQFQPSCQQRPLHYLSHTSCTLEARQLVKQAF